MTVTFGFVEMRRLCALEKCGHFGICRNAVTMGYGGMLRGWSMSKCGCVGYVVECGDVVLWRDAVTLGCDGMPGRWLWPNAAMLDFCEMRSL
jgi:hypothetical protein